MQTRIPNVPREREWLKDAVITYEETYFATQIVEKNTTQVPTTPPPRALRVRATPPTEIRAQAAADVQTYTHTFASSLSSLTDD